MPLIIGDNFKYGGKKFLDARQSFDTKSAMEACTTVPEGFITYCIENKTRYEFKNNTWVEFKVDSSGGDIGAVVDPETGEIIPIDLNAIMYLGSNEPEMNTAIWFNDSRKNNSTSIDIENPILLELMASIQALKEQVQTLQAEVEYLKVNGGGGGGSDWGDPEEPDTPIYGEAFLALEDGDLFLLEDGSCIVLEAAVVVEPSSSGTLLLEDGSSFLLEDGSYILLENSNAI